MIYSIALEWKIAFGVLVSFFFFLNIRRSCGKRSTRANLTPQPYTHKQHLAEKKSHKGKRIQYWRKNTSATPLCVKLTSMRMKPKQRIGRLWTYYIYSGLSKSSDQISIRNDSQLLFTLFGWNQWFPANMNLPFLTVVGVFSFLSSSACTWVTKCKLDISLFSSQYALCILSLKYSFLKKVNGYNFLYGQKEWL